MDTSQSIDSSGENNSESEDWMEDLLISLNDTTLGTEAPSTSSQRYSPGEQRPTEGVSFSNQTSSWDDLSLWASSPHLLPLQHDPLSFLPSSPPPPLHFTPPQSPALHPDLSSQLLNQCANDLSTHSPVPGSRFSSLLEKVHLDRVPVVLENLAIPSPSPSPSPPKPNLKSRQQKQALRTKKTQSLLERCEQLLLHAAAPSSPPPRPDPSHQPP